MHKLEKIIAISKMIDTMNEDLIVDNFKVDLQFNTNNGRILENDLPDKIVIVLQHEDWQRNCIYYEVYISFRTMREVMTEGETFEITIEINDGTMEFKDSCNKWISAAKEYLS